MGYKCLSCGNLFECGEEVEWAEPSGEKMRGCPICRSSYDITSSCCSCRSEFLLSELYHGIICRTCLIESISPGLVATYVSDRGLEKQFYIGCYFNSAFDDISDELLNIAKQAFNREAGLENLGKDTGCTLKCVQYILGKSNEDATEDISAIEDYVGWLKEQEVIYGKSLR